MVIRNVIRAHGVVGYHARLASCLREVLGSIPNVSIFAIWDQVPYLPKCLQLH
jgi:hypothetical protein